MAGASSLMLKIAALAAFLGPLVLFCSDLLLRSGSFEWTIGIWIAFMLMIPAVIGLTYILAASGSRLGVIGGLVAHIGLVAGASMQVLFRVYSVLEERGATEAIGQLTSTFKLIAATQMIGLHWPVGLVILAIACLTSRAVHIAVPILLIIGAIAFPIGRIAGSTAGVLISGAVFVAAFSIIGSKLWSMSGETS